MNTLTFKAMAKHQVMAMAPPEICEQLGWKEGDTINIEVKDGSIFLSKHE